jgi:hypothetical protein
MPATRTTHSIRLNLIDSVAPEAEVSSPCSQQPAIGPYPEPTESTLHLPPPANLPKIHSDPILPSTPRSLPFGL